MEGYSTTTDINHGSWLDRAVITNLNLNWEKLVFALLLILAFASRFYLLGERVMSHDENSHVYFSWLLEQGRGYKHDPVTHGPLQFHLMALSYFLFGDSDFTARIPAALFSVATVGFMWKYRRLIGRPAAMVAAGMLLISPYILYYGRYARNEAFVAFFGVVTLWALLRYLESGENRYLYYLTLATVLHFTSKETSFIYTAQALVFLALYLIYRVSQQVWPNPQSRTRFLVGLISGLTLIGAAGVTAVIIRPPASPVTPETAPPSIPGQGLLTAPAGGGSSLLLIGLASIGVLFLLGAVYVLFRGYTWQALRVERPFSLLVILGTLVMPMLSPFPVKVLGYNPIDYNNTQSITLTATFVILFALLAAVFGLLWNARLWLLNAALFYAVYAVFYTTIFTNGFGFITGIVGSLGYWLEQQGVNRGSQPWYYYGLVQVPIYEYLPALGSLFTLGLILARQMAASRRTPSPLAHPVLAQNPHELAGYDGYVEEQVPVVALLGYWSITSLAAYTVAGEKMPWLTVHITLPMILFAAWGFGQLIEGVDWKSYRSKSGWLVISLLPVFLAALIGLFSSLLGPNPPFQGKTLDQLQATSTFLTASVTAMISGWGLNRLVKGWTSLQLRRLISFAIFSLLAVLTARTAIMAAFINYDDATEFLVYAHSARGPKEALAQIEEISRRTTDGLALRVAYDDDTTYPYWWYLRNYPNQNNYGSEPTRALREYPVILVGDENFTKIEPVVGQAYHRFDYIRLWWPNQDYFNLTWDRIIDALDDAEMRSALFQIWLNRDYTLYGKLTNKDMSLTNWYPSSRMRLYIRKDIVSQLWNYGTTISPEEIIADPYEGKQVQLSADKMFGSPGADPGQFNRPRDLAVALDGTLYVADTGNHRIQHLDAEGNVIKVWGVFGDAAAGQAPPGSFNEPWGIALGGDGSVYVADTWNHRIQKFTPDGEFITTWGYFGQAETPLALWGPRDVAVDDEENRVFVTDTGNKRIVVYDSEGNFISEFGEVGLSPGQFDEPVGITIGSAGQIFVADTWNQRVQVLNERPDGTYQPLLNWEIVGWYGQSLDNKPYLTVDGMGHVYVSDPEGYRVLEFTIQGEFIRYWGDYGSGPDAFGLVGSVAVDPQGGVWVTDAGNSRLMHFTLPTQ